MILRIWFLMEYIIKDKLKIPIFHLRAKPKPNFSAQGNKNSVALFMTNYWEITHNRKTKIILVARYKLTLAKGCFAFDKTGEKKKEKSLVLDSWVNYNQAQFLFTAFKKFLCNDGQTHYRLIIFTVIE